MTDLVTKGKLSEGFCDDLYELVSDAHREGLGYEDILQLFLLQLNLLAMQVDIQKE